MSVASPLDATIGSLFLGCFFGALLYGMSVTQCLYYYTRTCPSIRAPFFHIVLDTFYQVIRKTPGGFDSSYVLEFRRTDCMGVLPPQVAVAFILNNAAVVLVMHSCMFHVKFTNTCAHALCALQYIVM